MSEPRTTDGIERDRLQVDLDDEILAASKRLKEIGWAVEGVYTMLLLGAILYASFSIGPGLGLLVAIGGYVLTGVPVVQVREEIRLGTDVSPDEVRRDFLELENPVIANRLACSDAVRAPTEDDDDDIIAIVDVSSIFVFRSEIPIRINERSDGRIGIVIGTLPRGRHVLVSVGKEYGTTLVEIEARDESIRPRHLMYYWLAEPWSRQIIDHYGYKVLQSETHLGLNL